MHEVNVTFGVKAHNADNLFIMYMYILLSWFNFGREPKIQEGEKKTSMTENEPQPRETTK